MQEVYYIISNFDESTLRNFINAKVKTKLTLEMIATDDSNLAKNSCELKLINSPDFSVAPLDPDKDDNNGDNNNPDKNGSKSGYFSKRKTLYE